MVRSKDIPSASNFPLAQPPPGVIPDFVHPNSLAPVFLRVAATCLPLMLIFIGVRIAARFAGTMKKSWANDIAFAMAVVTILSYTSVLVVQTIYGVTGRYLYEVLLLQYAGWNLRMEHTNEVFYTLSVFCVKIGIALFFLDVFGRLRWIRISIYTFLPLLVIFHLTAVIIYVVTCEPKAQTPIDEVLAMAAPNCVGDTINFLVAQGVFHVITDVFLLILPLPAIWSLHLPLNQKLGIMAMFSTGSSAVVASIFGLYIRIRTRLNVAEGVRIEAWTATAAVIELTAGLMILCMPAITAASRKWMPSIKSHLSSLHSSFNKIHKSSEATGPYVSKASKVSYPSDTDSGKNLASSEASMSYELPDTASYCYQCRSAMDKDHTTGKDESFKLEDNAHIDPCYTCRQISEKKKRQQQITVIERPSSGMMIRKQVDFSVEREPSLK